MGGVIDTFSATTGRKLKEDSTVVNLADLLTGDGAFARVIFADGIRPAADGHAYIHIGRVFKAFTLFENLANDASYNVIFTTADDYPHAIFKLSMDGSFEYRIFEAPAFSVGTSVNIKNLKRTSTRTYGGSVVHTPTITNDGDEIMGDFAPGGIGPHSSGSGDLSDEIICKTGTSYLVRMTNRSGLPKRGAVNLIFITVGLIPDA